MKNFKEFRLAEAQEVITLAESIEQILALEYADTAELMEAVELDGGILLEADSKLSQVLSKIGLTVHKQKGLIDYLRSAGKGIAKLFMYAIKGDKEGMKKVVNSVRKEDVLDFLLKLDMATLHLVTGPIHTIDAITGWELWANIKKKAGQVKGIVDKIKEAIRFVKQKLKDVIDETKAKFYQASLDKLEKDLAAATAIK